MKQNITKSRYKFNWFKNLCFEILFITVYIIYLLTNLGLLSLLDNAQCHIDSKD